MKKIIIIGLVVLILAGAGFALWKFYPRPTATNQQTTGEPKENKTELPSRLLAVSSVSIIDYWIKEFNSEIYYISSEGIMYANKSGKENKINGQAISNLNYLIPSADGASVIAVFGSINQKMFSIFDTNTKSWRPLPASTESADWDPTSNNRIAYLKTDGQISSINVLTLSDKKSKEIIKLAQKDFDLDWISPKTIYLKGKPTSETTVSLWSLDIDKKTIKPIIQDTPGADTKWSKDGSVGIKLLNGVSINLTITQIIDQNGNSIALLDNIALPSKCLPEKDIIYCAVPRNITSNNSLLDNYLKRKLYTTDDIVAIDLNGSVTDVLLDGDEVTIDAENLQKKGNQLLFINRYDQKLYSLEL